MSKLRQSSADKIWKETLDCCASRQEVIVFAIVVAALLAALLITDYGLGVS